MPYKIKKHAEKQKYPRAKTHTFYISTGDLKEIETPLLSDNDQKKLVNLITCARDQDYSTLNDKEITRLLSEADYGMRTMNGDTATIDVSVRQLCILIDTYWKMQVIRNCFKKNRGKDAAISAPKKDDDT